MDGAVSFAFRLGCTLLGIMVAHAVFVAESLGLIRLKYDCDGCWCIADG
jgi:hypothetical protein